MTKQELQLLYRIEGKQEAMEETLNKILVEAKATNGRVRSLESWRSLLRGVWLVVVVVAPVIGGILGLLLSMYLSNHNLLTFSL